MPFFRTWPKTKTSVLVGQGQMSSVSWFGALGWLLKCKTKELWLDVSLITADVGRALCFQFLFLLANQYWDRRGFLRQCITLFASLPFAGMTSLLQAPVALILLQHSWLLFETPHLPHPLTEWRARGSQASPSRSLTIMHNHPGCPLPLSRACVQYLGIAWSRIFTHTCIHIFMWVLLASYLAAGRSLKQEIHSSFQVAHHLLRLPWVKSRFMCHILGPDTRYGVEH